MSQDQYNRMSLEGLLLESAKAEASGVFIQTELDPLWLERGGRFAIRGYSIFKVAVPLAAALLMAFGLSWIGRTSTTTDVTSSYPIASSDCPGLDSTEFTLASFSTCVTGPNGSIASSECLCADFDRDGDVDLLDFGRLQLEVDSPSAANPT